LSAWACLLCGAAGAGETETVLSQPCWLLGNDGGWRNGICGVESWMNES
jgi:hypothetical protein